MNYRLRQVLVKMKPTNKEIVLFQILSVAVLIAVHYSLIINRLLQGLSVTRQEFKFILDPHVTFFNQIGQTQAAYYVVIALFWAGLGIVTYFVLLTAAGLLIELKNLMVYEASYTHKSRLTDSLRVTGMRLSLALMLVALVIVTIVYGLPLWFTLFIKALLSSSAAVMLGLLAAAVFGLAVNLYTLWVVTKLFIRAN